MNNRQTKRAQDLLNYLRGDEQSARRTTATAVKRFFAGESSLSELDSDTSLGSRQHIVATTPDGILYIQGIDASGECLDEINIPNRLKELGLKEVVFMNCMFKRATFKGCDLGIVAFHGCELAFADFTGGKGECVTIYESDTQGFRWEHFEAGAFCVSDADLLHASFAHMVAKSAEFERVSCWSGADTDNTSFPAHVEAYIAAMRAYEEAAGMGFTQGN